MKTCKIPSRLLEVPETTDLHALIETYLKYAGFTKDEKITITQGKDCVIFKQEGFYTCKKCGRKDGSVIVHHIYGRRYTHLKDNPMNHICLCNSCHVESPVFSSHKTPEAFMLWMRTNEHYRMEKLRILAHRISQ